MSIWQLFMRQIFKAILNKFTGINFCGDWHSGSPREEQYYPQHNGSASAELALLIVGEDRTYERKQATPC